MEICKPGRRGEDCDSELSQYSKHKKRYCKNGDWEKKPRKGWFRRDTSGESSSETSSESPSSPDPAGEPQSAEDLQQRGGGGGGGGGGEEDQECDSSHNVLGYEAIHLTIPDSSDSDEEEITFQDEYVRFSSMLTMAQRDGLSTSETPQLGRVGERNTPAIDSNMLFTAITGLSRQLNEFAADVSRNLEVINKRLQSIEDRLAISQCESNSCSPEELKRKRRLHKPKIVEAVHRLHNSEANSRRYDPEQGFSSSYNEMVTAFLMEALSKSPELSSEVLNENDLVVACKSYYETVRRNFQYRQPELSRRPQTRVAKGGRGSWQRGKGYWLQTKWTSGGESLLK